MNFAAQFTSWLSLSLFIAASGCTQVIPIRGKSDGLEKPGPGIQIVTPPDPVALRPNERLITILGTNDIHGGVEPSRDRNGNRIGGMPALAGTVKAIREGLNSQFGDRAGVVVVDGGDQFQGTLISNFNEGQLVFNLMNEVGYDAVVPGNHDYDFGPTGWLDDEVSETNPDKDPRGALMKLKGIAKFPLISANTYFKASIETVSGAKPAVAGIGCKVDTTEAIRWENARRPEFLTPYVIKQVAGARVALVGLDNPITPQSTTAANVSDLCFRSEVDAYKEIRAELEGKADVFVIVIHNGNINTDLHASNLVTELTRDRRLVDAVVAGHTHQINNVVINGVPVIQSGANGQMFGRIDLVWDAQASKLVDSKMRKYAGAFLSSERCFDVAKPFCDKNEKLRYEGAEMEESSAAMNLIEQAKAGDYAKTAGKVLGQAEREISKGNSFQENALSNVLTDLFRDVAKVDVAFMNTGGMRTAIKAGPITYEDFYRVLPFNNRGLVIGPMKAAKIRSLVERSITFCSGSGTLMQSGLKVEILRDCAGKSIDPNAKAMKITMVSGEVVLDVAAGVWQSEREFLVATLNFLHTGGSGYTDFVGTPVVKDIGIVREAMVDHMLGLGAPLKLSSSIDGRWKELPLAD